MSNDNPFSIKIPCENCPFRKEGAIDLRPGRLQDIIDGLIADDRSSFWCHKAYYGKSQEEKVCAGSAAYLEKIEHPNVAMRFFRISGLLPIDYYDKAKELIIEPEDLEALNNES